MLIVYQEDKLRNYSVSSTLLSYVPRLFDVCTARIGAATYAQWCDNLIIIIDTKQKRHKADKVKRTTYKIRIEVLLFVK